MPPLSTDLRRLLEKKVVEARDAAELAAVGALKSLAVDRAEPFPAMSEEDRQFRRALRARARQHGTLAEPLDESIGFAGLVQEVAYEQWHRMLFARFLAENDLLIHPGHGVPVTLRDCAELAESEGEPDEWMLAARFAAEMLPGIFRVHDPAVRVRFAPEGRQALERILAELPREMFLADDALGWVYQFWQTKKKKEVNASERKIGGPDLPPVTQLFTEHYMVAFLLENSLGAWWAVKHPDSPLLRDWQYLRFAEDGSPAAGTFEAWPQRVAEVTVMDPCCGSGHFLVAAFEMLRRMREEEDGLSPRDAADAVLRDNLFGLELDGRCIQIAVFALALGAWKVGGYRELPAMNLACSGVPARGSAQQWRAFAQGDGPLADALERLYYLFRDADTLGSLIDPRRAAESDTLLGADYEDVAPLLHEALQCFGGEDPAQQVLAQSAEDVATAARLLAGRYTLAATNPPFLTSGAAIPRMVERLSEVYPAASIDLATAMFSRVLNGLGQSASFVLPQAWLYLPGFTRLRTQVIDLGSLLIAVLGTRAFETISGEVVSVCLTVLSRGSKASFVRYLDADEAASPKDKAGALVAQPVHETALPDVLRSGRVILLPLAVSETALTNLDQFAHAYQGIKTGDDGRYRRYFWELTEDDGSPWRPFMGTTSKTVHYGGRSSKVRWDNGRGAMCSSPGSRIVGREAWGRRGVNINQMGQFECALYDGELFDTSASPVIPNCEDTLPALWCFLTSSDYPRLVRQVDRSLKVSNGSLTKVPFDLEHWAKVAADKYPNGLPEPHSDDPKQWLFKGNVVGSESPLHVAVARLVGYRWPDQEQHELDRLCDPDGIVSLPAVAGERPASERLLELLVAAYGEAWSPSILEGLLASDGARDLESLLRDKFFASHCRLFQNRPFIWQIWDGCPDGFSALVNYHKLDRRLLERLTYSILQSWIDRQKHEADQGKAGAEARLVASEELKRKLELIIDGEPPYDIYVRWKPIERQPIGWEPDINDGVRLNIRPFVKAGVLRILPPKLNVKWEKDRGKNPDGSERLNDLHFTIAEKRDARAGRSGG